jgi:hypothetical protein
VKGVGVFVEMLVKPQGATQALVEPQQSGPVRPQYVPGGQSVSVSHPEQKVVPISAQTVPLVKVG